MPSSGKPRLLHIPLPWAFIAIGEVAIPCSMHGKAHR